MQGRLEDINMKNAYDQAKQIYGNIMKYKGSGRRAVNNIVQKGKDFVSNLNPNAPIKGNAWEGVPMASTAPVVAAPNRPIAQPIASPVPQPVKAPTVTPTYDSGALARNPSFKNYTLRDDVKNAVMKASEKYSVPHQLLFDLFAQESSLLPDKVNDTPEGIAAGYPTGLGQFTNDTWDDVLAYSRNPNSSLYGVLPNNDRKDPYTNALATAYLVKMGQLGKWDASEDVWGEFWSPQELEDMGFYNQSKYHIPGMRPSIRLKVSKKK